MPLATLGSYRLVALLGHGGMSDVYLAATDAAAPIDFTKLVALKRLRGDYFEDIELVTSFLDEARIAARLNHPNVVLTHEVNEWEGEFFLAMEYLEGETLGRLRDRTLNDMPLGTHLTVLGEALAGIEYAHQLRDYDGSPLRIVHRDVTPQNIFITFDGRVKVVDFGIAKATGRIAETRHGVIKGKVHYMAPEQAIVGATVDHRADLFAVGVMIYEACLRRRMWEGISDEQVLRRLGRGDIPTSIKEIDPSLDDQLEDICARALAFDPERRYSSARELQADLEAWVDEHARRPSARQLGELLAQTFAGQRKTTQQIIESQMSALMTVRYARRSQRLLIPPHLGERASRTDAFERADLSPVDAYTDADEPTRVELASTLAHGTSARPDSSRARRRIMISSMLCLVALALIVVSQRIAQ